MNNSVTTGLVLLTFNDKILLMLCNNRIHSSEKNTWSFIEVAKKDNESFESIMLKELEEKTNLKQISIKFLTALLSNDKERYIYHVILTADNLNNIKRGEGTNLDFFTLQETEKLYLEKSTKKFLLDHKTLIKTILHN